MCNLCPRKCRVDRGAGQKGFCLCGDEMIISKIMLHMWEEPCISGDKGSGAVFFSGCNLGCVYCQNCAISSSDTGRAVSPPELADIFLRLEGEGAHNINLVTPTHFCDKIQLASRLAKDMGLGIPVVYNTGGYELKERIKELDTAVDVYLTDFKYINPDTARRYSKAPDYPKYASQALDEMVRTKGNAVFENSLIKKGVIVRHLLLPGGLRNSKGVIEYLYKTYGDSIYISIMSQYTPVGEVQGFPELSETPSRREYDKLVDYALSLGVKNAYIQDMSSSSEVYIPDFDEFTF